MHIVISGAGAWGTAMALFLARSQPRHVVGLLTWQAEHAAQMQATRANPQYLPGHVLPPSLQIGAPAVAEDWRRRSDLWVIATPVRGLAAEFTALAQTQCATGHAPPCVWLCKGMERDTACLPHELQLRLAPQLQGAVLSGPSFAAEIAAGQPAALVVASNHAALRQQVVLAFHHAPLRIYESTDCLGVELGGAVKNVIAIATGLCDGLALGLNARAALITRGLAEMSRLGLALGAQAQTFLGLAGLGDLVLTATGDLSRNRQVGLMLAQGGAANQAEQMLGHVSEGLATVEQVLKRAAQVGVEMPISTAVRDLVQGRISARQAVQQLLQRSPGYE